MESKEVSLRLIGYNSLGDVLDVYEKDNVIYIKKTFRIEKEIVPI